MAMMTGRTVALALLFAASACATGFGTTAASERTEVEVDDDGFSALVTFRGLIERIHADARGAHMLRSWVSREGGDPEHQVYVSISYDTDWRFYTHANALGGEALDFVEIDRDVTCSSYGCTHYEVFGVGLSDATLREHRGSGFPLKAYAQSGHELVLRVTPQQIAAQLAAMAMRTPSGF